MEPVLETAAADSAIVVRLGAGRFALPMAAVAEVGRPPALTRVPGLPGWLAGVVNWRGRVLPVVDARGLLGAEPADATSATRLVVVGEEGLSVGLVADAVEGTVALPAELEAPTPMLSASAARLVSGQALDEHGPLAVLDVTALLRLRDDLPRARRTA